MWSNTKQNWNSAEQMCLKNGGHLASITNQDIHNYILNKIQSANKMSVWVGGTDKETEGTWKWSDGSLWDFSNWANQAKPNNYRNQDCLAIMKMDPTSTIVDGWHDTWCDHDHRFLCSCPLCGHKDTTGLSTN